MLENNTEPISTEEKIKDAARKVFLRKGFSGTRTRDIADEAGINLALLNYYFRSKQKLFEVVIQEKLAKFLGNMLPVMFDENTPLEMKIEQFVSNYIDLLLENPDLPIFVISELHKGEFETLPFIPIIREIKKSPLLNQFKEKQPDTDPVQFLFTLLGMTIFPFVAKPIITLAGLADSNDFEKTMLERKQLIISWMKTILNAKTE